jgi:DNA-directed RNA polymerase specialized sigma24 family protein
MGKARTITTESFNALLVWLDSDSGRAGERYEEIRRALIKIFVCRGCQEPENLADETIDRVITKVPDIAATYSGEPALYFYGVARNVLREHLRKKCAPPNPPPENGRSEVEERKLACLEACLAKLSPAERRLIIQYYQAEKGAKIENRKDLARELGIALNALRIRTSRIRAALCTCVKDCLDQQDQDEI